MSSELEEIYKLKKSVSAKNELAEVQRQKEIDEQMKGLSLSEREYNEFLKKRSDYHPSLYDVNLALDDFVVQDYHSRMALFTSFVMSKIPTYVSGVSAGGKSVIMEAVSNCLMPNDVLLIESASDKAIYDQQYQIKKASYLIMRELNKINPAMIEILKNFGEGKPFLYRRSGGICGKLAEIELPPKPFCFSKADESTDTVLIPPELMSRVVEITVNGSQEQTKKVLARKAINAENPFDIEQVDMVQRAMLRYHISTAPEYDLYINPMSSKLIDTIPTVFTSSRRDFDKYLKNIVGVSRFNYKDRMCVIIQDKRVQFITPQDVAINQMIFGKVLIQSSLHCSDLEKLIISVIKYGGSLSKSQVQSNLRKCSMNCTIKLIGSHLDHLVDIGYLDVTKEGSSNFYNVSNFYEEFVIKPDFREIVDYAKQIMLSTEHYKPYADEYIDRYCNDDKLFIIDPFSGNRIDILSHDFGSPTDLEDGDTRMKRIDDAETVKKKAVNLADFM